MQLPHYFTGYVSQKNVRIRIKVTDTYEIDTKKGPDLAKHEEIHRLSTLFKRL